MIKKKRRAENNVNKEEEIGDSHTHTHTPPPKIRSNRIQKREEKCVFHKVWVRGSRGKTKRNKRQRTYE
jgi:hypothetical protein